MAVEAGREVASPEQKREHHFGFVGGSIAVKTEGYGKYNGSGHFAFSEAELEWDEDQESGRVCRWVRVEKEDLLEIRDFLNRMFPKGNGTRERWLSQTITHTENGPPGNCVQAALASILSLPLEAVPHFVAEHGTKWEIYFNRWLEARGWEVHRLAGNYRPDGLYLASGISPRGVRHMVVMRDRDLIHDPHPSREGLLEIDEVRILAPADPATFSVSDGSLKGQDATRLDPKDDSAAA